MKELKKILILLIDNYDSFTYNLFQMIGEIDSRIVVYRNDVLTVDEVAKMNPSHIIISPGPGFPAEAGISIQLIRKLGHKIPILGVCLGHQAIGEAFGGKVVHAPVLMHGKTSQVLVNNDCLIFNGMKENITAARYHSLIVEEESLPDELVVTARTASGEIMGLQHKKYPVYGIQFHPESIMTPDGTKMLENFLKIGGESDDKKYNCKAG